MRIFELKWVRYETIYGKSELEGINARLDTAVMYKITSIIQRENPRFIPILKVNNLRLFHSETLQMMELTLHQPLNIDNSTTYYIRSGTILCCGDGVYTCGVHNNVYEVHVRTEYQSRFCWNLVYSSAGVCVWWCF